jgi:hypothetical protein
LIIVPADRLGFQNRVGLSGQCGRNHDQCRNSKQIQHSNFKKAKRAGG